MIFSICMMEFILQLPKIDEKVLNMDKEKCVIQAKHILYLVETLNLDNCIVQIHESDGFTNGGPRLLFLDNITEECLCQVNFNTGTFVFNNNVKEFSQPHRRYCFRHNDE